MATPPKGILPDKQLRALVRDEVITAHNPIHDTQYQPASLDLRLGAWAYRLRASFLPDHDIKVDDLLKQHAVHDISLKGEGAILEKNIVYLVPLQEKLALRPTMWGFANPKSSIGRLDVFVRVVSETADVFDEIPKGYCGKLYLEIMPRSFPVRVRQGSRLAQLRLSLGGGHQQLALSDEALKALHAKTPLAWAADGQRDGAIKIHNGVPFTVNLAPPSARARIIGYRAKRYTGVIDIDKDGQLNTSDFWSPLRFEGRKDLVLDPGHFYILSSREYVRVPPDYAAEMISVNPLVGEFRVHYAGFFDPGFGIYDTPPPVLDLGEDAPPLPPPAGARAVLEVRSLEVPFMLRHGQLIGHLKFMPMIAPPDKLYGAGLQSHYQAQGLRLSKHFRWQDS